jgi:predicted DNA-binding protein
MVSDRTKARLNEIAYEQSSPNDRVTAAEIVRESIKDYVEKYEDRPESCAPLERGSIDLGLNDDETGVA